MYYSFSSFTTVKQIRPNYTIENGRILLEKYGPLIEKRPLSITKFS